jgi:glutamine synthetase
MSISEQVLQASDLQRIRDLESKGVEFIRLQFSDLHGVARGKVIPISQFEHVAENGIAFAGAVMTCDLRHNTVAGVESGLPDMLARPDLSTLVQLPWETNAAWCIADLESLETGLPYSVNPRSTLRNIIKKYEAIGLAPVFGPELEFYIAEADENSPGRAKRYFDHDSHVYTVGSSIDPGGILEYLLDNSAKLGLGAFAANHEYGRGQFEINLRHSMALDSADRAFRYKTLIKELAARKGLMATFMGKPWNDDEGSGLHLHISFLNEQGSNAFYNPQNQDGLSDIAHHFIAGVLARCESLIAILNPTVNAYRRINANSLAPTRINWGYDNRFTLIRVPNERRSATRAEIRVADGTANPYLAYAAILLAGLEGIQKKMLPPAPIKGYFSELPEEQQGELLPTSLDQAIRSLERDEWLCRELGSELMDSFLTVKKFEYERYSQWVSDWELREYIHHL